MGSQRRLQEQAWLAVHVFLFRACVERQGLTIVSMPKTCNLACLGLRVAARLAGSRGLREGCAAFGPPAQGQGGKSWV